jgi:hypothetical protein
MDSIRTSRANAAMWTVRILKCITRHESLLARHVKSDKQRHFADAN